MNLQHYLVAVACDLLAAASFAHAFSPFMYRRGTSVMTTSHDCLQLQMAPSYNSVDQQDILELETFISSMVFADPSSSPIQILSPGRSAPLMEAASPHGMPWDTTIGHTAQSNPLLYMPFWIWQLDFMRHSLANLHPINCASNSSGGDFAYNENKIKCARVVNQCYASDEYRKIRMTYYDAGDSMQVFNSVWYPDAKYNLPILGVDMLSFNRKKYLTIVDFQPLHKDENDHATPYEHMLKPIREQYDNLKGRMSTKFYDETQFFSNEILFARFEDDKIIKNDVFPTFQSYVKAHVDLIHSTQPLTKQQEVEAVYERHRAYDTYSAGRDPAVGLFAAMFGAQWAEDFVHGFLFSLSERTEERVHLSDHQPLRQISLSRN